MPCREVNVFRFEALTGEQNGRDGCRFMVNGQQFDEFQALLDRPPQRNEGLERLFTRVAPWEAGKDDSAQPGGL